MTSRFFSTAGKRGHPLRKANEALHWPRRRLKAAKRSTCGSARLTCWHWWKLLLGHINGLVLLRISDFLKHLEDFGRAVWLYRQYTVYKMIDPVMHLRSMICWEFIYQTNKHFSIGFCSNKLLMFWWVHVASHWTSQTSHGPLRIPVWPKPLGKGNILAHDPKTET